jgi:hypothetical protein
MCYVLEISFVNMFIKHSCCLHSNRQRLVQAHTRRELGRLRLPRACCAEQAPTRLRLGLPLPSPVFRANPENTRALLAPRPWLCATTVLQGNTPLRLAPRLWIRVSTAALESSMLLQAPHPAQRAGTVSLGRFRTLQGSLCVPPAAVGRRFRLDWASLCVLRAPLACVR